jgi:regulator of sigma E protease
MFEILVAVFGLTLLVIVHECGHYFAARAFGVRVTRFSIGFGPVIAQYQPKGSPTVFQLCVIPFLAYVMYQNMGEQENPDDPSLYSNKSVFARTLTVLGGPFANYLAASMMIFGLAVTGWRVDVPTEPMIVESVEAGSPAATAGLRKGDVIVHANGKPIRNVEQLIEVTRARAGQATSYGIERDGKRLAPLQITPRMGNGRGVIGVSPRTQVHYEPLPISQAAELAVSFPWALTVSQIEGIADSIRHRTAEGIVGPVGMGKLVAQQATNGVYATIWIVMLISVALGFGNLLPLPALDGGKLVFLGIEMITRRRPNERIEGAIHAAGIVLLLGLIALVTFRDIVG